MCEQFLNLHVGLSVALGFIVCAFVYILGLAFCVHVFWYYLV